jgi:hypothetical protein
MSPAYLLTILFNAYLRDENEFSRSNFHINKIKSSQDYTKNRLVQLKGMNKSVFNSFL